jgi:hypothetical protein
MILTQSTKSEAKARNKHSLNTLGCKIYFYIHKYKCMYLCKHILYFYIYICIHLYLYIYCIFMYIYIYTYKYICI